MLVYTIKELCRTCYTCVRECPAKAIRIVGGQVEVIVENGIGIKEEDRAKIFEPFYTTKGIGHGTGPGLVTAYGIVKMHKGQITAELILLY